jgi:hypothetical protein
VNDGACSEAIERIVPTPDRKPLSAVIAAGTLDSGPL